jgi:hypothetical protein
LYHDVISHDKAKHLIGTEFEKFERRLIAAAFPQAITIGDEPYGPKRENKENPGHHLVREWRSEDCV